ncbi:MAG: hypothetical protein WC839_01370 [Candidatus Paceibacterota bacterium]
MKTGMIENTFDPKKSLEKKIKESGLKEKIEPFDVFSCGTTAESKLESDPTFSKELEKKDFDLDGEIVDIYRIKKDNEPLREIYIHMKG